ncbi:MAG: helix-turn-helix domain containing protein [Deinococcales bacterium]
MNGNGATASDSRDEGGRARRRVGRPRVDRSRAEARRKILDAAEALFAEGGFDGTPTSAIAAQAGVTSALIFYYFRTKRGLLQALIDERPFLPRFAELVADVEADDRRTLLRTAGQRLYDLAHRSGPMVRIVVREVLQREELRRHWEDVLERAIAALADRIRTIEEPPLDVERAAAMARLFFNAVAFQALFGPDIEPERAVSEAVDVVLTGR